MQNTLMYISEIYRIAEGSLRAENMLSGLEAGDIDAVMSSYNMALSGVPCNYFKDNSSEAFYCALFMMLLRAVQLDCEGEAPGSIGRPDIIVRLKYRIWIFEFKFMREHATPEHIDTLLNNACQQIADKHYADKYASTGKQLTYAGVVIDGQARAAVRWRAF